MINVIRKKCIKCGSEKRTFYNYEGKPAIYCFDCKEQGMINVISKLCIKCNKTIPKFNYAGKPAKYYANCKELGMINVKRQKCIVCHENIACYNYAGNPVRYCFDCKDSDMIDVTHKRCIECKKVRVFYGLPGKQPTHCATHKLVGMICNPRKKCIIKNCKEMAIYGINKQLHCEKHKEDNELNLIERKCESCGLIGILDKHNKCETCNPRLYKRIRLARQQAVKAFLDANNYNYIIYDKIVNNECSKYRPDFLFDANTHYVIVEVDEDQHKGINS